MNSIYIRFREFGNSSLFEDEHHLQIQNSSHNINRLAMQKYHIHIVSGYFWVISRTEAEATPFLKAFQCFGPLNLPTSAHTCQGSHMAGRWMNMTLELSSKRYRHLDVEGYLINVILRKAFCKTILLLYSHLDPTLSSLLDVYVFCCLSHMSCTSMLAFYLLSKGRLFQFLTRIDVVALRSVAAGPAGDAKIKVGPDGSMYDHAFLPTRLYCN